MQSGVIHGSFNRHKLILLVLWVRHVDGLSLAGFFVQGFMKINPRYWIAGAFLRGSGKSSFSNSYIYICQESSPQPQVSVSFLALIWGKLGILRTLVLAFSTLEPIVVHLYMEYAHSTAVLLNKCVKWAYFCKPEQLLCKICNLSHNCEFTHTFIT